MLSESPVRSEAEDWPTRQALNKARGHTNHVMNLQLVLHRP